MTVGGASATGSPTLAGTGTIGGTGGTVTIAAASGGAAGTLAPGSGGIGNLVINNKPLTFESGSTASFEVDADTIANRDRVTGISALTYSGKLQITATGTLSDGDTWDLFDFSSQSGTFDNNSSFGTDGTSDADLPDLGAGLTWQFDYTTGTLSVATSGGNTDPTISDVVNQSVPPVATPVRCPSRWAMRKPPSALFAQRQRQQQPRPCVQHRLRRQRCQP